MSYRCVITDAEGNTVISEPGKVIAYAVTWKYDYDANGMRTSRTNNATTYRYVSVVGGSVNILGLTIGFDYSIFDDIRDPSIEYHGFTLIIGAEAQFPVESHGYVATSGVLGFNVWDLLAYIFS